MAASATAQLRPLPGAAFITDGQEEELSRPQPLQIPLHTNPSGSTARASLVEVGQRQTRDAAAGQAGIKPMARIASRVGNRVQNRVRNRIDRFYNPQASATDPVVVASDQARSIDRRR